MLFFFRAEQCLRDEQLALGESGSVKFEKCGNMAHKNTIIRYSVFF